MDPTTMTLDQLLQALKITAPTDLLKLKIGIVPPHHGAIDAVVRARAAELSANPAYFADSGHLNTTISFEQFEALRREAKSEAIAHMTRLFSVQSRVRYTDWGSCEVEILDTRGDVRAGEILQTAASGKTFAEAIGRLVELAPEYLSQTWEEFLAEEDRTAASRVHAQRPSRSAP